MRWLNPLRTAVLLALAGQRAGPPRLPVHCPDHDHDGVCDVVDLCAGDDAIGDGDGDGRCDDRDVCAGDDRTGDADADGVCADRDLCLGDDARGDSDADTVCDDLDACTGDDRTTDGDHDGLCDDLDPCWGDERTGNDDSDGWCNDVDVCDARDRAGDLDSDGECEQVECSTDGGNHDADRRCDDWDLCQGATWDADVDGVCDDLDPCAGLSNLDGDADGSCDDRDLCAPGEVDLDGDGRCGASDACLGTDTTGDRDADGVCDDVDPCDDLIAPAGALCELPDPIPPNPCRGEPVLRVGRHTGFVTCADGSIDRLFATRGWAAPETETPIAAWPLDPTQPACADDADCADRPDGACATVPGDYYYVTCVYGCDGDSDCATGELCLPPGVVTPFEQGSALAGRGVCVAAGCGGPDDCPDTSECAAVRQASFCRTEETVIQCRTTSDECRAASDCNPYGDDLIRCEPGAAFTCVDRYFGGCGRPLVDDEGIARLPEAAPAHTQAAAAWDHIAAMEFASVASFARHALELLTLGAPADLIAGVAAAQADELRHTALARAVAARAGGGAAPGPLPLVGVTVRASADRVIEALVQEGCVGETLSAAEALLMAELATVPEAKAALRAIASDEARHAALAWRTLRWWVAGRPDRAARAEALVRRALASGPATGDGEGLVAWGIINRAHRAEVFAQVRDEVILPAVHHLADSALLRAPAAGAT